ncbi:glycoside hydrolase family 9 protein [Sanguibacter sp. 25GB23B1]|uniref:glycoside hydrolase family 9 protein n=1 Tax=unclassified Sanguibacter TaxID=2645534 RepID=UPI0032AEDCDF
MVSPRHARQLRAPRIASSVSVALVLAAVAAPSALASPVGAVHDFIGGDPQGWYSYANAGTVTSSTATEEFCSVVEGGENPWDIAAQHDGIAFDRNATYTVSFDARADAPATIPMQAGPGYPATTSREVVLDGSSTPQHVELTFSPASWPTSSEDAGSPVEDTWTTTTGNAAFQLGAQPAGFTFCLDNFSITSATAELVVGGDFDDGTLEPFYATGAGVTSSVIDGVLCAALDGGTSNRWDQIVGFNGVVIEPGTTYTLSFDASSSSGRPVRAVIGDDEAPYGILLEQNPTLTTEMRSYAFTFTPEDGFPASDGEDPASGEVSFQVGGADAGWTFCLDNVSLRSGTVAPPYAPETGSRVRVNQVGYLPDGPKQATLVTDETAPVAWEIRDAAGAAVSSGATVPAGVDATAGLNVHELDFSNLTAPGTYTLVADGEESHAFVIDAGIYQQLRYDALNYFYPARSGIAIDGSVMDGQPDAAEYSRPAGHVATSDGSSEGTSANRGDADIACLTPATEGQYWMYGDWTCNYTSDVTGGWYDAGDHGKYVVNGGIAVAQILSTYERTRYSPTAAGADLGDGTLNIPLDESSNGVPDVLDEARWELEWMMKMQVPAGADMYAGMVHHKVADADWTGLPLLPSDDPQERYLHRPSTAATLNFAAVAAHGARLWAEYDPQFAADLLAAGQIAWDAALATPDLFAPAPNADPSPGSGPYNDTTVGDEFYWAAAELFLSTGEQEYEDHVLASEYNTADIWTAGGFNWFETAALGRLDLATVESDIPGRAAIRDSVVTAAERYLAWQTDEPFGTAYPGSDGIYDWGSNSAILNNQVVMGTAFDLTSDQRFADGVLEAMDYLLGRNALNNSYITGYGETYSENQHSRWFADSLEPALPNPPRGSVSGGPNSNSATWDPVIKAAYSADHMCAPQLCYLDDIQSWSTNEITVNWNSALAWVSSFVADQADGNESAAGDVVHVLVHPEDITVVEGHEAAFTATAAGNPAPAVQWQRLLEGVWTDVAGATASTMVFTARPEDGGEYRAFFVNEFGGFYTDSATLAVTAAAGPLTPAPAEPTLPGAQQAEPGPSTADGQSGNLARTGVEARWMILASIALLIAGAGTSIAARRARERRNVSAGGGNGGQ